MLRAAFLLVAAMGLAGTSAASGSQRADLQSRAERLVQRPEGAPPFVNGGLVIGENGQVLVSHADGYADYRLRAPLDVDAVFPLASGAKPFTSVAILQLRDRGRLRLEDAVGKHLPGFPFADITIRHLLSHTSGLPDLELYEPLIAARPDHVVTGSDLVPALRAWKEPLRFAPGTEFRYSNINYQLLARIVEVVSGQSFGEYMRERVFRPAGMRSSYVRGTRAIGAHREPVTRHTLAVMFRTEPEDVSRLGYRDAVMMRPFRYEGFNLGSTVGDQNLFSTLGDLVKFDKALSSAKILSLKSQEEAYAPVRFNDGRIYDEPGIYELYGARCSYGFGWEVCRHPERGRLVGHAGFSRGIATMLYRELDSRRVVVMYDNGDGGAFGPRFASLVNAVHGKPALDLPLRRSLTREYGRTLVSEGPVAALIRFNRLKSDTERWTTTSAGMNQLGYDLLRNGYEALALDAFRLNLVLNPDDANAYDSYGEALAVNGRRGDAILAYRRALELEPDNKARRAALDRLERESVEPAS
ncbi:serine hydrolase domain-containing protein [Erythrobacter donghaensis]|jgi:CubicO group peptidase (beta-lactamase class C family)|uniref:serine hydrolase domain-containing protein n=1 Tax=Erythrobacter donghaensis TaxID=267135 RepID=UPI00093E2ACF|nr:serine hydrolase domain-containing protein [Erythrobacter donghaensis]